MVKEIKPQPNEAPEAIGSLVQQYQTLSSMMMNRLGILQKLGYSYGTDRDIYTACGYPKVLTFENFNARYIRQGIAKKLITALPNATWRIPPNVVDNTRDPNKQSQFEIEWKQLVDKKKIYHYLNRVDKLAGIGQYAVMLIGFDNNIDMKQPVTDATDILYLQTYSQKSVEIMTINSDTTSERFGYPEIYKITMNIGNRQTKVIQVHWTRVLHVADGCDTSDIYGTPRLEDVYNDLQNLETVMSGGSEMYWRGAFPGMAFIADKDADMSQAMADLENHIKDYMTGLNRYMRLQGVDPKQLSPTIVSPKETAYSIIAMIAGAKGIPIRKLIGSERGELASTQDDKNWNDRVDERRRNFAEPIILRTFIDRLIDVGVLPVPYKGDYEVVWPDINALTEKEQTDISEKRSKMLKEYVTSGAEMIVTPVRFAVDFLGYSEDEANGMIDSYINDIAVEETGNVV